MKLDLVMDYNESNLIVLPANVSCIFNSSSVAITEINLFNIFHLFAGHWKN